MLPKIDGKTVRVGSARVSEAPPRLDGKDWVFGVRASDGAWTFTYHRAGEHHEIIVFKDKRFHALYQTTLAGEYINHHTGERAEIVGNYSQGELRMDCDANYVFHFTANVL